MFRPISIIALAAIGLANVACGPKVPTHNGYKAKQSKPWQKAKVTQFDEQGEAELDSKLSWTKRRRARWFAVDVPAFGDIKVTLRSEQVRGNSNEFDVAFELLSENGKVLVRADREEDDSGEETKERALAEVDPGRYLVHVFLQDRRHAATFNLRIKYERGEQPNDSTFPREVDFVSNLPAVPPVDDAPIVEVRKKCRGKKCKRVVRKDPPKKASSKRFRITGITAGERGTRIRIGAGKNRGITKGTRGRVVSKGGGGIEKGGFSISRVTANESFASVGAKSDAVNAAKYVSIKIPEVKTEE